MGSHDTIEHNILCDRISARVVSTLTNAAYDCDAEYGGAIAGHAGVIKNCNNRQYAKAAHICSTGEMAMISARLLAVQGVSASSAADEEREDVGDDGAGGESSRDSYSVVPLRLAARSNITKEGLAPQGRTVHQYEGI